jgi:hypothetical protein
MTGDASDCMPGAGLELELVMGEVVEKRLLNASWFGCRGCGAANCVFMPDAVVEIGGGREL